ncbi:hypothetical protein MRB53_004381 [Persea americana]|uniref:Uncharacterized protein n=2 Tax=Persea americana TaxID=3435 RepID=A0ACC2MB30_PERAE|nr:hypothetical protein MRB53_004378 [Persea americana]KAJ8642633.1 hypothetical protein MRB53_004381 [Persea americana]
MHSYHRRLLYSLTRNRASSLSGGDVQNFKQVLYQNPGSCEKHELVDKIFSGKDMSLFQSLVVDTLSGSSNEQAYPPRSWHV